MKTYKDKLSDLRWIKRRREIINRDNFRCTSCDQVGKNLHVHHTKYIKGREPWEYEDIHLVSLCADCHKYWHYLMNLITTKRFYIVITNYDHYMEITENKAYEYLINLQEQIKIKNSHSDITEVYWPLYDYSYSGSLIFRLVKIGDGVLYYEFISSAGF
ncbi:MAG: HNH endonuclease [Bacteroidales bacterium]